MTGQRKPEETYCNSANFKRAFRKTTERPSKAGGFLGVPRFLSPGKTKGNHQPWTGVLWSYRVKETRVPRGNHQPWTGVLWSYRVKETRVSRGNHQPWTGVLWSYQVQEIWVPRGNHQPWTGMFCGLSG